MIIITNRIISKTYCCDASPIVVAVTNRRGLRSAAAAIWDHREVRAWWERFSTAADRVRSNSVAHDNNNYYYRYYYYTINTILLRRRRRHDIFALILFEGINRYRTGLVRCAYNYNTTTTTTTMDRRGEKRLCNNVLARYNSI